MTELLRVPPTRSTLIHLRQELAQLREGYELLEHKREILVRELMEMLQDAERSQEEAQKRFRAAYEALEAARMRLGTRRLQWVSLAQTADVDAQVRLRSVMGVTLPMVHIDISPVPVPYSPGDTSALLDEARARWLDVVEILAQLTETVASVWRLAMELRKTQRRVNALEYVFIPQYEATVQFIAAVLEEQERESFVYAKKVKALRSSEDDNG